MQVTFDSVGDLAQALRRAEQAHGQHEAQIGRPDPDWPTWYAQYLFEEQAGRVDQAQRKQNAAMLAATELSGRAPQHVFAHHGEALTAENLDAVARDYAETACLITPDAITRGKKDIRAFFARLIEELPHAHWHVKPTFADNILLLEWTADSARGSVSDGVETFVFQDGLIHHQTIHFTLIPKP